MQSRFKSGVGRFRVYNLDLTEQGLAWGELLSITEPLLFASIASWDMGMSGNPPDPRCRCDLGA